jgi:hypothetical protein
MDTSLRWYDVIEDFPKKDSPTLGVKQFNLTLL